MNASTRKKDGAKKKILVIDDDSDTLVLVGRIITRIGFHAVLKSNAEDGLICARKRLPDLILCDIRMPGGMDGNEFARRFRTIPGAGDVPLLAFTVHTLDSNSMKSRAAGFDGYIPNKAALDAGRFLKYLGAFGARQDKKRKRSR